MSKIHIQLQLFGDLLMAGKLLTIVECHNMAFALMWAQQSLNNRKHADGVLAG